MIFSHFSFHFLKLYPAVTLLLLINFPQNKYSDKYFLSAGKCICIVPMITLGKIFKKSLAPFRLNLSYEVAVPSPICTVSIMVNPINLDLFLFQVAPMTAVPAREGATKTFQDIFLNQDAEQLCLPAYAR
jgi:hypothetical protein